MKDLSQKKPIYKALIFVSCILSFVPAYLVYSFGFMQTDSTGMTVMYILLMGVMAYLLFELVNHLSYMLFLRYIPNFVLKKSDYKLLLRVFIIFRNIVYSLINIIFIFYPIASVWGILINYCVTTTAGMIVMYYTIKKTYDIKQQQHLYANRMVTVYCIYLVIYLMVGALVWKRF